MSQHRIHSDLFRVPKVIPDPGAGGTILVDQDLQICEMVSAAKETRALASPTKPGIRFVLRLLTDGGTIDVTNARGFDSSGTTQLAFADAGDLVSLISVEYAAPTETTQATYRWQILEGNVGVTLA